MTDFQTLRHLHFARVWHWHESECQNVVKIKSPPISIFLILRICQAFFFSDGSNTGCRNILKGQRTSNMIKTETYPKFGDVNRSDPLLFITEDERRANSNLEQSQIFFICGKVFTAVTKSINKRDVNMKI